MKQTLASSCMEITTITGFESKFVNVPTDKPQMLSKDGPRASAAIIVLNLPRMYFMFLSIPCKISVVQ